MKKLSITKLNNALTNLPLEDFIKVIKIADDYDIWVNGAKQMGTNLDDKSFRAGTIDHFEKDDIKRYNKALNDFLLLKKMILKDIIKL